MPTSFLSMAIGQQIAQQPANSESSANTSPAVVLDVHLLVTLDGSEPEGTGLHADRYPKTISVQNAAAFSDRISAYGAAYRVWIAPKGWTGSATIGADGNTDVDLHSVKGSAGPGQRFHYQDSGGCEGCAVSSAAPYFPSAMAQWKQSFSNGALSPLPPGIKITRVSDSVVTYSYPSGHDLLASGVVHFDSSNQFSERAEFVLPRTDSKLSNFLLQNFITTMPTGQ